MSRLEEIRIEFWLNEKPYAEQYGVQVPDVGDNVYFNGVGYTVIKRDWFYDKNESSVILFIADK
jgi:hypothetical protein